MNVDVSSVFVLVSDLTNETESGEGGAWFSFKERGLDEQACRVLVVKKTCFADDSRDRKIESSRFALKCLWVKYEIRVLKYLDSMKRSLLMPRIYPLPRFCVVSA